MLILDELGGRGMGVVVCSRRLLDSESVQLIQHRACDIRTSAVAFVERSMLLRKVKLLEKRGGGL